METKQFVAGKKLSQLNRWIQIVLILAFITCLAAYAYIGSFMRLNGDDYCYGAFLSHEPFWKAQWNSYLNVATYNGNRFSLTLFSGLAGLFPPAVNGFLPGLVIIVWLAGIAFALSKVFQVLRLRVPFLSSLLIAAFVEFITFFQAPDIGQSLYWRTGMLTYTLPIVFGTYLFGLLLDAWAKDSPGWGSVLLMFLLAFFGGGSSETGAVFQAAWLVLMWLFILLMDEHSGKRLFKKNAAFLIAMGGTILALLLLALSPTNQMRLGVDHTTPALSTMVNVIADFTFWFVVLTLHDQPFQSVFSLIVPTILAFAVLSPVGVRVKPISFHRRDLAWITVFFLAWIGLIAVTSAPIAYIQLSGPELRAQIIARFVMTLCLTGLGLWMGLQLAELIQKLKFLPLQMIQNAALVVLVLSSFYPVRAAWQVYQTAPRYQKWASFWDTRDREIHAARAQGISNVQVVEIDHIINNVGDLSSDPGYWYNGCAAIYYQVNSIRADLPGWDQ